MLLTIARLTFLTWLVNTSFCAVISRDITKASLRDAYGVLQKWYNPTNGLWMPSTGWWNSANCLTMIVNLASVDDVLKHQITGVVSETFVKAPYFVPPKMTKVIGAGNDPYMIQTYYADQWPQLPPPYWQEHGNPDRFKDFLNEYYDDEGWWALGWIAAYDLTKNPTYLTQAEIIFKDMYAVFGKTNCSRNSAGVGGIWWNKSHSYVNAIANELFFSTAASLANRVKPSHNTPPYLSIAKQQWSWFKGSGMIRSDFTINDGLDQQTCRNNEGTIWTYNQGVVLGGLVELSKAVNDQSYIDIAHSIAGAAMDTLAPGGILRDPCEPNNCLADGSQFKGIFVRNLFKLHKSSPKHAYKEFILHNARSIWAKDRNEKNELSLSWAGPLDPALPANASTQSSAMDCLVAAVAVA